VNHALPPQTIAPWAEGDTPHCDTLDVKEVKSQLEGFLVCRSFRADMRHKLEIIIRAHGGYLHGGLRRAAKRLHCSRWTLRRWYLWKTIPNARGQWETIDNAYIEGIEELAKQRAADKRKRKVPSLD